MKGSTDSQTMENVTSTHAGTGTNVQDMWSDIYTCKEEEWETKHVNDVSMSDVHRAVNAFITSPGSSTQQGGIFVKQEPEDYLQECSLLESNTNNEGYISSSSNTLGNRSLEADILSHKHTYEQLHVHEKSTGTSNTQERQNYPKGNGKMWIPCKDQIQKSSSSKLGSLTKSQDGTMEKTVKQVPTVQCSVTERTGYYVCPIERCNLNFSSKQKVNTHVRIKHKGFQCMKCEKKFCKLGYLKQHDNVHKRLKPYKCEICKKRFHTNTIKLGHIRIHHIDPVNKGQCYICGLVGERYDIDSHIRQVHLKMRFKCQECKAEFAVMRLLRDHIRMHRGEEPYTCDICQKSFVQRHSLQLHIKNHYRKFPCPKCDKVFKSRNYLNGHLRLHDGIKKYCCKICGKTFTHIHYLFTHMKSHGEKEFECAICGGKFNRKDNLKAHIIRHLKTGKINFKKK